MAFSNDLPSFYSKKNTFTICKYSMAGIKGLTKLLRSYSDSIMFKFCQ